MPLLQGLLHTPELQILNPTSTQNRATNYCPVTSKLQIQENEKLSTSGGPLKKGAPAQKRSQHLRRQNKEKKKKNIHRTFILQFLTLLVTC